MLRPSVRTSLLFALAVLVPSVARAQGVEAPRIPLRTSLAEIATLRAAYADAFGRKDAAALAALFAPNAVMVQPNGSVVRGPKEIAEAFKSRSQVWSALRIDSDTVSVSLSTAWDAGTLHYTKAAGGEDTARYLVVLRRGMQGWKLASVAVVPVTGGM